MFKPLQTRTLSVRCDAFPTWGNDEVLAPVRLRGTEALGKLFRYELDLMTIDSPTLRVYEARKMIRPDELAGAVIDMIIEFEGKGTFIPGMPGHSGACNIGAGTRTISGLITSVQITGSDDRHMYYRFIVRPSLWLTKKAVENRIFQNSNVVEITEDVLADYNIVVEQRLAAPGFRGGYPVRDYVRQFWCSDFEFLTMLWREWGIYYFYDGSKLVLCDSPGSHRTHDDMCDEVRYHAPDGARIDEEHIHRLEVSRRITTGQVDLVDYDYTQSRAIFTGESYNNSGPSEQARHYQWGDYSQPLAGAQGLSSELSDYETEANNLANVRLDAMRCRRQRLKGTGNLRGLSTGKTFWLIDHPEQSVNADYLVVSTTIDIRNSGLEAQRTGGESAYQCVTDFVLQPANTFFRNRLKKKPRAHAETAVVTSHDDRAVWPDAYARVKAHFVWDRRNEADLNSSCWLRVASPWQGNGYGFIAIPRIGDEVTVSYHEGDPDKPFVSASKVNQFNQPPWKLPDNLALTGLRSRDLEGGNANHVLTDDTPGKLQVQIASDHAQSRLVLGYNTRIDGRKGRSDPRGEGFELATEKVGVVRANTGMLVTTEARSGAGAPAKDMGETVARLTNAQTLHDDLATVAQQNEAQQPGSEQSDVTRAIGTQNNAISGDTASGEEFPEFTRPDMVLSSAAGVAVTARCGVHVAANDDVAVTAGRNVALAAARSLYASVRDTVSMCVMRGPMKLVSAMDRISIVARNSLIELRAREKVSIGSLDTVEVLASNKLVWNAGGTQVVIDSSGFTVYTGGKVMFHSADVKQENPLSVPAGLAPLAPHPIELSCSALQANEFNGATTDSSSRPVAQQGEAGAHLSMQPLASGQSGALSQANNGQSGSMFEPDHSCTWKLRDIQQKNFYRAMETVDYRGVFQDGTPYNGGAIVRGGGGGTFDMYFEASTHTITATVRILVHAKVVQVVNAQTGEPEKNADGSIKTVPYHTSKDQPPGTPGRRIVDRPFSEVGSFNSMKGDIEAVLNQDGYKLAVSNCPRRDQCSCKFPVFFRVEFVSPDSRDAHHAEINLYPTAERADSANWGEKGVSVRSGVVTNLPVDHVKAHEVGHLLSFPDEYYDQGGSVHKDYVKPDQTINLSLAQNNPNKDTWQGTTRDNLMGRGMFNQTSVTPPHYIYRIRDWFQQKVGRQWSVTK
ncbi:type VI secretion system Vgr family protein [Paraburkholderia largidicola]|uniref:Type IV secretion protein Rhs n=1 Tax=Paraburkholderia largidicola TaxID=3014751 RepID=A0A7I8BU92_9BURK|nr:type VI secretion system Vgr family protein [Paraburkholderia sp. PGU16]BCF92386.1 hypothetical protein PPGU16_54530 [Paraburkholderia sp. PGU16]